MYQRIPRETVASPKGSAENNLRTTALVCSSPIENEENPSPTQLYACQTIQHRPVIFEKVQQTMVRIVHVCIDLGGKVLIAYVVRSELINNTKSTEIK
jgi:hypothetical protein